MVLVVGGVMGFSGQHNRDAAKKSQLMMSSLSPQSSRRDVLSNAVSAVAAAGLVLGPTEKAAAFQPGPITAQSAANKAAESYQGVWSDPNHPQGYRVIMASGKKGGATMTLSDGVPKDAPEGFEEKTYKAIPVAINEDSGELTFDFSFSKWVSIISDASILFLILGYYFHA